MFTWWLTRHWNHKETKRKNNVCSYPQLPPAVFSEISTLNIGKIWLHFAKSAIVLFSQGVNLFTSDRLLGFLTSHPLSTLKISFINQFCQKSKPKSWVWRPEMLKEHFDLWKMYVANLQELKMVWPGYYSEVGRRNRFSRQLERRKETETREKRRRKDKRTEESNQQL